MSGPIRVLHVIDHLGLGGAQTVVLNIARYLDRTRFHLEVASMHGAGEFAAEITAMGIPVHSLSPDKWPPRYVPGLWRLLGSGRFDICHFHLFGANWIARPLAALKGGAVLFAHDHCNDPFRVNRPAGVLWDALTNRLCRTIFAVSQSTRKFLLDHERLAPDKVRLMYNGVDLKVFHPCSPGEKTAARKRLGLPADTVIVGGVGRLVPQKNFELFLDVAAKTGKDIFLLIAGEGSDLAALKAHAASLGLGDRIIFAGFVSDRASLFHALDVFLLTSRYEGLPMTILEAMASGVPIVASQVDGVAEILTHGGDAMLPESGDRDGFVTALSSVLDDPEHAGRLAARALERVRRDFDAAGQAAALQSAYEEAMRALRPAIAK